MQTVVHKPVIGRSTGLTNEIFKAYNESQNNFEIKVIIVPYKRALYNMKNGLNIVISTSQSLKHSDEYIHWPVIKLPMVLLGHRASDEKSTKANRDIALIRGEEQLNLLGVKNFIKLPLKRVYVNDYESMFKMLDKKRIDYVFCGLFIANNLLANRPDFKKSIVKKLVLNGLYAGLTLRKSFDIEFQKSWTQFIKTFIADENYKLLVIKYLKESADLHTIRAWKPIEF